MDSFPQQFLGHALRSLRNNMKTHCAETGGSKRHAWERVYTFFLWLEKVRTVTSYMWRHLVCPIVWDFQSCKCPLCNDLQFLGLAIAVRTTKHDDHGLELWRLVWWKFFDPQTANCLGDTVEFSATLVLVPHRVSVLVSGILCRGCRWCGSTEPDLELPHSTPNKTQKWQKLLVWLCSSYKLPLRKSWHPWIQKL